MPQAAKATAGRSASGPGYEGRFDELGDYTVAFEEFSRRHGDVGTGRIVEDRGRDEVGDGSSE